MGTARDTGGGAMADISEALERLAGLRDRGILTSEEFDRQKAALLAPPAAPVPPVAPSYDYAPRPAAAADRTPFYIVAGIVLLAIIGAGLWAAGVFGRSGPATVTAGGTPPFGGGAPAMPSGGGATADPSGNPLIGEWLPDVPNGECPTRVTVTPTQITALMSGGRADVINVSFTVLGGGAVQMTDTRRPESPERVTVRDGHMNMQECGFHRG